MPLFRALLGIALLAVPGLASAQIDPCPFNLPCGSGGAAGLAGFLMTNGATYLKMVFIAVAIGYFFYYAFRMVFESQDESVAESSKKGFSHLVMACIIVSIALLIVSSFGRDAAGVLVNPTPFNVGMSNITLAFRFIVGAVMTGVIAVQGFLLVIAHEQGDMEKHQKRMLHAVFGVAILMLADSIVGTLMPGNNTAIAGDEIRGIANFLLTIFATLTVIAVVIAGAFFILSVDEGLKDKAKNIIRAALINFVVVLCAYLIVVYFILQ